MAPPEDMRSRPLVRNVLVNLAGQAAPLLAAAISMPLIASGYGIERLGVLSLSWAVLGFFGLLDLGLGRALTQLVVSKLAARQDEALPGLFAAGCGTLFGVGLAAACAMALGSDWLAVHAFTIYPGLQSEARGSLYLLAAGVPFLTASSAARGFLEGHQRFGWVNIVRSPLGVLTYVGPVLVLPFSNSVTLGVGVIVLARVVACVVYVMMGWALLPKVRTRALLNATDARELVSSGAWITSANIVASATAYLDRLLVGAVVSIEALAYYATPQEVIGRVTILPTTVAAVMFPAFGAAWAQPSGALTRLFEKTSFYSHLAMFPITFVGAVFAPQWLSFWMGPAFAERSAIVTQIFCLGVFLNCLAVTPFSLLQAVGRADLTAKLQAYQLPPYLIALWSGSAWFGITGAAVVWAARALVNVVVFYAASCVILPHPRAVMMRQVRVLGVAFGGFVLVMIGSGTLWTACVCTIVSIWFIASLKTLIEPQDWKDARALVTAVAGSRPR